MGGVGKGGIVVRAGEDVATDMAPERLDTGTLVRELALISDRLHFEKVSGLGPATGWVSIALKDGKPLMERRLVRPASATPVEDAEGAERELRRSRSLLPVEGRKARVLAMHGCPGNASIMKFMCNTLKTMSGDDMEWVFPDGPCPWTPVPGSTDPKSMEPSEFAKRIAGKKPFVAWYSHPADLDPAAKKPPKLRKDTGDYVGITTYGRVEEGIQFLDEYLQQEAPIDVVVAFSQAGTLLAMLIEAYRKRGKEVPWRLSVVFCGGMIDDPDFQFDEMSPQPTVYIVGGDNDPWAVSGKTCLPLMYTDLTVLEHNDGHVLPTTQPQAGEVYARVSTLMRAACGMPAEAPPPPVKGRRQASAASVGGAS